MPDFETFVAIVTTLLVFLTLPNQGMEKDSIKNRAEWQFGMALGRSSD